MSALMRVPPEIRDEIFTHLERPEDHPIHPIVILPSISRASWHVHHDYIRWFYSTTIFRADSVTSSYRNCFDLIEGWQAPGMTRLTRFLDSLPDMAVVYIRRLHIRAEPSELLWLFAPEECIKLLGIPVVHFPYWQQLRQRIQGFRLNILDIEYDPTHCCPWYTTPDNPRPRECRGMYFDLSNAIDDRWIWKAIRETINPECRVSVQNVEQKDHVTTHYSAQEMDFAVSKSCSWNLLASSTPTRLRHTVFHTAVDPCSPENRKHYWYVPIRLRNMNDHACDVKTEECAESMGTMFLIEE